MPDNDRSGKPPIPPAADDATYPNAPDDDHIIRGRE